MSSWVMGSLGRFLAVACLAVVTTPALAGDCACKPSCASACEKCCEGAEGCDKCTVVEKTVRRPQWVTEMKTVTVTEYEKQEKEKTYTVCKKVPHTERRLAKLSTPSGSKRKSKNCTQFAKSRKRKKKSSMK